MNDEELVITAADELTRVYSARWPVWVNLRRLSMLSMHQCVLAQVEAGSGLDPVQEFGEESHEDPFTRGIRRMHLAYASTDAFIVSPGESISRRRRAWKREIKRRRR